MTDHSDLIARLQDRAASYRLGGPSSEHTALLLDQAASALSSQSLSLSEAGEEIERLREALEPFVDACPDSIIPDLHPMVGEGLGDEWRPVLFVRDFRRARSVLENGPADLADAPSNRTEDTTAVLVELANSRASSDLSSLRKGAEVAVKPLEWRECAVNQLNDLQVPFRLLIVAAAETRIGTYGIAKGLQDRFEVWIGKRQITGSYYTKAEALSAAQSDFETRIRSAIVSGSREER